MWIEIEEVVDDCFVKDYSTEAINGMAGRFGTLEDAVTFANDLHDASAGMLGEGL